MPEPIPTNVSGFFDYQFHQVAIFTDDQGAALWQYYKLGYERWIHDTAELKGLLHGEEVITKADMAFNYDIMPMELEFLTYHGPNRHAQEGRTGRIPFISHMSVYVDDVRAEASQLYTNHEMLPYHRFITQNHSNPNVIGKKRFIECIYDTRVLLGYDLKLIQKVAWDFNDDDWLLYQI